MLTELALKEVEELANQVRSAVSHHCDQIEIAGSIRRQKPFVHDIDFVAVAKSDTEWKKISEEQKRMKAKQNCSGSSIIKAYLPLQKGLFQVDFYRAKPSTFGIHLLIRTGSAEHNMWLAGYAISQVMRLKYSEGLIKEDSVKRFVQFSMRDGKAKSSENLILMKLFQITILCVRLVNMPKTIWL